MALSPGYKHDIFISYVHDDNDPEIDGDNGWVDKFYKYLETKLKKHSSKIDIWWDSKDLRRGEVFDRSIMEAIDKSAVMICLYSRRYPQSDYCQKELEYFHKKAQDENVGLDVGNDRRIIPVFISNIQHQEWLEKVRGTSGYPFHDAKDEAKYGDPLEVTNPQFKEIMQSLRDQLVNIFDNIGESEPDTSEKSAGKPEEAIDDVESDDRFTIFLAEISDSLLDRRDGIISELKSQGYTIITGDASVADSKSHLEMTKASIASAQLSVHLLSEFPGRKIKDDPNKRYIQEQLQIGLETNTPQLVWLASDFNSSEISNNEHKQFLDELENRIISEKHYDFVKSSEAELAALIIGQAQQLKEELEFEKNKESNKDGAPIKVLLDTHTDDFEPAFDLRKLLTKNNVELIFNEDKGDPQENIKSLYENINEAQKFIFLYGSKNHQDWVDIRVKNTLKKLTDYDRFGQDIFIYMTPPQKKAEAFKVAQSPLVKVIDHSTKDIDQELIDQLLAELKSLEK